MAKQLSEAEKFYIEGHAESCTADQIAKVLERSIPTIRTYIKKMGKTTKKKKTEKPAKKGRTEGDNALARRKGIVLMTQEAAEAFDQTRNTNRTRNSKYDSVVQKIRDED